MRLSLLARLLSSLLWPQQRSALLLTLPSHLTSLTATDLLAPAHIINLCRLQPFWLMMIYAGGIEGSGTWDTGQEKATGSGVLTTQVVPRCRGAPPRQTRAAVQEGGEGRVWVGVVRGIDLKVQGQWRTLTHSTSWKCHTVRCQRAS